MINIRHGALLEIAGTGWGPCTVLARFELTGTAKGAQLRFSESSFGRVDEATVASKEKGWRFLLDGCLRARLEGTEPPAWDGDC